MARGEARIYTSIWDDDDFLALDGLAQRMFMFLVSQTDLAHDGVIALRERRWARKAKGMTVQDVQKALADLNGARFVVIDEDEEELLIRSFIRRDKVYRQPNVLRAAADHLPLVQSHTIRAELFAEACRVSVEDMAEASTVILAEMMEALRPPDEKPSRNPSGNPSDGPTDNPSGDPTPATPGERGVVKVRTPRTQDLPRTPESPTPATPTASGARAKRATRIPDDFAITDAMRTWAAEHTPDLDIGYVTAKFIDYWRGRSGKDATKTEWLATWRNWMRNEAERRPNGRASPDNGYVERNGARLKADTARLIDDDERWAAEDAARAYRRQPAIEGTA